MVLDLIICDVWSVFYTCKGVFSLQLLLKKDPTTCMSVSVVDFCTCLGEKVCFGVFLESYMCAGIARAQAPLTP